MTKMANRTRKPKATIRQPAPQVDGKLMRSSFLASATVHVILLLLLAKGLPGCSQMSLPKGGQERQQSQDQSKQEDKQAAEDKVVQVEILPPPPKEEAPQPKEPELDADGLVAKAHNEQKCPDFYGGVGMMFMDHNVVDVVEGYPAARAGIKWGDKVLAPTNTSKIKGEIGTEVEIVVDRGGQLITFKMKREKICTTREKKRQMDAMDKLNELDERSK